MNYELTMLKIWPTVKVTTCSEKVMLHISRSVWSAWTHILRFDRSSLTLASHCRKTAGDLSWPEMTLWHEEGSLVAIFRFRVSTLPINRCLRVFQMVFVQKRSISIFSHWLIMEKSQNWPDLGSPISKFRDTLFKDNVVDINRGKFQGNRSVQPTPAGLDR